MNKFPLRCITAKNPRLLVATGPKGFEPLTTWLKARRSTELSYEPTLDYNVQRYNNAGKPDDRQNSIQRQHYYAG